MKPIKVFFDKKGNTLNVWFDDPSKEAVAQETAEEVILVKDSNGKVIGFEVLNYLAKGEMEDFSNLTVESEVIA